MKGCHDVWFLERKGATSDWRPSCFREPWNTARFIVRIRIRMPSASMDYPSIPMFSVSTTLSFSGHLPSQPPAGRHRRSFPSELARRPIRVAG